MKLFLSPHNDDETLFGAFTIQREKPVVVIVFDSYVQGSRGNPVTLEQRREESRRALLELAGGWTSPCFLGFHDDQYPPARAIADLLVSSFEKVEHVWAPAIKQDGHEQHNIVGEAACIAWPGQVTRYLTYTRTGGKSTSRNIVPIESGDWVKRKLRAMACYESQIDIERLGCREHFLRDLHEYYE